MPNQAAVRYRALSVPAAAVLAAALAGLLLADGAARALALPLLATAALVVLYVAVLRARDGELPVCELGSVCVMITALYASVPLAGYWLGGRHWSAFSDQRLYASDMAPADVAAVAWRYVAYLASFVLAYLAWRGRSGSRPASTPAVDGNTATATVLAIAGFTAFFLAVFVRYGTSESSAYASSGAVVPTWDQLPPLVYFGARAGMALLLVAKLCLMVMLFQRWGRPRYRMALLAWLALETAHAVSAMGVRRDVAMLLMVAVLLYHRLVRPLAAWQAAATVAALLAGLLEFGFVRQGWGVRVPWSANNEFQVLFANAWDLLGRREQLHVPWQIYLSDLLRLIPRDVHRLLPFEVLDPSLWYLRVLDVRDARVGLMFGVVAQSILGFDWLELVLRGAVLGVLSGAIHRWYVRSSSLWATVLYLYLCVWAYYTVRATTFHVVSLVFWRLLPSVLVLVPAAYVIGRLRAAASAWRPSVPMPAPSGAVFTSMRRAMYWRAPAVADAAGPASAVVLRADQAPRPAAPASPATPRSGLTPTWTRRPPRRLH